MDDFYLKKDFIFNLHFICFSIDMWNQTTYVTEIGFTMYVEYDDEGNFLTVFPNICNMYRNFKFENKE